MLGVPQLVANWRAQSVKGVSRVMITMWFLGDFGKTIYFLTEVITLSKHRRSLFNSSCVEQFNLQSTSSSSLSWPNTAMPMTPSILLYPNEPNPTEHDNYTIIDKRCLIMMKMFNAENYDSLPSGIPRWPSIHWTRICISRNIGSIAGVHFLSGLWV